MAEEGEIVPARPCKQVQRRNPITKARDGGRQSDIAAPIRFRIIIIFAGTERDDT